MMNRSEIVIIGAGAMGVSTAYHLAKLGHTDIVVLEKNTVASGSTGKGAGGFRVQFSTETNIRIAMESIRDLVNFADEMETDIGLHQYGYMLLATTSKDWEDFHANVALQKSLGAPVELLSQDDLKMAAPYLYLDDVLGGTFCPMDGWADPYSVAMGFAKQARRLGVRISEGVEVTGIHVEHGRVEGVLTKQGEIATHNVVNAAGAWGGLIGEMAGVEIPIKPYRRQILVTAPFDELPDRFPLTIDFAVSWYFHREGPGLLVGMSDHDEPPGFDQTVSRAFLNKMMEHAMMRVPVLERAGYKDAWAGLYEITPDDNPVIGLHLSGVEGLHCVAGFSGHGFMQSPAIGRLMADVLVGRKPDIDLSAFALDRFKDGTGQGERAVI